MGGVKIEGDSRDFALLDHLDQGFVRRDGRRACWQSEHEGLVCGWVELLYALADVVGRVFANGGGVLAQDKTLMGCTIRTRSGRREEEGDIRIISELRVRGRGGRRR